jgi:hypothetical protein
MTSNKVNREKLHFCQKSDLQNRKTTLLSKEPKMKLQNRASLTFDHDRDRKI